MPLPRSWAEARCHPAIQQIQTPVDGISEHWVTLAEPWVAQDVEGTSFPVFHFRELQRILRSVTQDASNERRCSGW
jgi:hypothetical protein